MTRFDTLPGTAQNDPPQQWRDSGNLQLHDSGSAPEEVAEEEKERHTQVCFMNLFENVAWRQLINELINILYVTDYIPYQVEDSKTHSTRRCCSSHLLDSFYKCTAWCWERWHYNSRSPVNPSSHRHNLLQNGRGWADIINEGPQKSCNHQCTESRIIYQVHQ